MNAHINRDLPLAVVRTCEAQALVPRRGSGQHTDFEQINGILERVEIRAIQELATGIIGKVTRGLGRVDDVIAMWNVRKARDAAWTNGEVFWSLRALPDSVGTLPGVAGSDDGLRGAGVAGSDGVSGVRVDRAAPSRSPLSRRADAPTSPRKRGEVRRQSDSDEQAE